MTKLEVGNLITSAQSELKELILQSYSLAAKMENIQNNKTLYGNGTVVATGQTILNEINSLISTYGLSTTHTVNNFKYFDLSWLFPSNVNWLYGNSAVNEMNTFLNLMVYGQSYNSKGQLTAMAPFDQGRDATYNFYNSLYEAMITLYKNSGIDATKADWFVSTNNRMPAIISLFRVADSFASKGLDFWSYFSRWGSLIMPIFYSIMGTGYTETKAQKDAIDAQIDALKNTITDLTIQYMNIPEEVPIVISQPEEIIQTTIPELVQPTSQSQIVILDQPSPTIMLDVKESDIHIPTGEINNINSEAQLTREVPKAIDNITQDVIISTQLPLEKTITVKPKSKTPMILAAAAAGVLFLVNKGQ